MEDKVKYNNIAKWNKLIQVVWQSREVAVDIFTALALSPREYYNLLDSLVRRYVKGNGRFGVMDQTILNNVLTYHPVEAYRAIRIRGGK